MDQLEKQMFNMDQLEKQMFNIVNRNHEYKAMADKLNAIAARRRRKGKK